MLSIHRGCFSLSLLLLLCVPAAAQLPPLDFANAMGGVGEEEGFAIALGPDKSVYITGSFEGTMDFDPGPGDATRTAVGLKDVYVAKYDDSGVFQRVWTFGGTNTEATYYIDADAYGGYYICGEFYGSGDFDPGPGVHTLTSAGGNDFFMLYVDANGDLGYVYQWGTPFDDAIGNFVTDRYGNTYFGGSYETDPMDADPTPGVHILPNTSGNLEGFLVKLAHDGTFSYGISFNNPNDVFVDALAVGPTGTTYMATEFIGTLDVDPGPGVHNLSSTLYSAALVRLDDSGNFVDAAITAEGVSGSAFCRPYFIDVDQHGNIYITGYFRHTVDFDPGPGTLNYTSPGNRWIFVQKLDRNYNLIYAHAFGSSVNAATNGAAILSNSVGAAYVVGRFSGSVDFDPGAGVTQLTAAANYTAVMMNFEPDGSFGYAFTIDGSVNSSAYDLVLDRENELYVSGAYQGTGDFDPGPGTLNYTSAGQRDIWVSHYGQDVNVITTPAPYVVDISLDDTKAIGDPQYTFIVTFSEAVTGVDVGDFTVNGTAPGTITGFSGSGDTYEVTVDVGALDGLIYLDLIDDDSIAAAGSGLPLGETGLFNGDYYDGEVATVSKDGIPMPASSPVTGLLLMGMLLSLLLWRMRRTAQLDR